MMKSISFRSVAVVVSLLLLAPLTAAIAAEGNPSVTPVEPGGPVEPFDPLVEELALEGLNHPVLDFWRVDDGNTVSLLWQFTTPQMTDIPAVIEVPQAGDYPWYAGSNLSIVDPTAYWTGNAWAAAANPDGEPFLRASDTNPTLDAKKTVVISYWWRRPNGQATPPGPTLGIDTPGARFVDRKEWPSHLYPGASFVIVTVEFGPPCPGSVSATLTSAWGTVQVRGFLLTGSCPG